MPEELPDYPCLAYGNGPRPVEWGFRRSGRKVRVALRPLVRSNNLALLLALTAQGLGIALLPDWVIADGMGLISVLHDWTQLPREVEPALFAVYPEDRGKARLRNAFVGALKEIVSATRPT